MAPSRATGFSRECWSGVAASSRKLPFTAAAVAGSIVLYEAFKQRRDRQPLAEGEGFEPSRDFNSPNPLSRRAH